MEDVLCWNGLMLRTQWRPWGGKQPNIFMVKYFNFQNMILDRKINTFNFFSHISCLQKEAKGWGFGGNYGNNGSWWRHWRLRTLNATVAVKAFTQSRPVLPIYFCANWTDSENGLHQDVQMEQMMTMNCVEKSFVFPFVTFVLYRLKLNMVGPTSDFIQNFMLLKKSCWCHFMSKMCLKKSTTMNEENKVFYFESTRFHTVRWPGRGVIMWFFSVNMAPRCRTLTEGSYTAVLNVSVILYVWCFICVPARAEIRSAVVNKQSGQLSVLEGFHQDFVAWANFTDDINTSGWVDLHVF